MDGPKLQLRYVILVLCQNVLLTYVHLDIVHFYCVEVSIWTHPKLCVCIVQMVEFSVSLDQRLFRQSKILLVGSNFGLSKITVVERNCGLSKITMVDRSFGPSKTNIVDCYFGPSKIMVVDHNLGLSIFFNFSSFLLVLSK